MAKVIKDSLGERLKKLEEISTWFDEQEEIDLEKGLEKVKEGAALKRDSRLKLKTLENEFEEIKATMESEG